MSGRYPDPDPAVWKALQESRIRTARHQRRKAFLRWFLSREARIAVAAVLGAAAALLYAFNAEGSERRRGAINETGRIPGYGAASHCTNAEAGNQPGRRLSDLSAPRDRASSPLLRGLSFPSGPERGSLGAQNRDRSAGSSPGFAGVNARSGTTNVERRDGRERPALSFLRSRLFQAFVFCLVVVALSILGRGVYELLEDERAEGRVIEGQGHVWRAR